LTRKFLFFPPDFGKIAAAVTLSGAIFAFALAQWVLHPVYEAQLALALAPPASSAPAPTVPQAFEPRSFHTDLAAALDRGSFLLPGIAARFQEPAFAARVFDPEPVETDVLRLRQGAEADTIVISALGASPETARRRVGRAARLLLEVDGDAPVQMFQRAGAPGIARRVAPDRLRWTAGGLLAGLLAAWGLGRLMRHLDARRPTRREIETALQLPLLCTVPCPDARTLRNRFRFLLPRRNGAKVLLFAGVGRSAGKSAAVAEIAGLFAADGKRVLVVGPERRTRRQFFRRLQSRPANETVLAPEAILASDVPSRPDQLYALPGAAETPRQTATHTRRLEALLLAVADRYDLILIDSPSARGSAAPVRFGHLADAVILVADGRRRELEQFRAVLYYLYSTVLVPSGVILTNCGRHFADDPEQRCCYRYGNAFAETLELAQKWRNRRPV